MAGFTTAAILGGLAAGGSIGGALIGSKAAGSAAKAQAAAGESSAVAIEEASRRAAELGYGGIDAANIELDTGRDRALGWQREALDRSLGTVAPYQEAGTGAIENLADLLKVGGEFNRPTTMADLEMDPGFAFRMQEGQKALERSAAARGTSLSGGALKELERYSQGVASDEYSKAFDRFRTGQNDRFSKLSTLAGFGQDSNAQAIAAGTNFANQAGGYEMNTAGTKTNVLQRGREYAGNMGFEGAVAAGNARTGAANARAAGTVGSANAWANAIGSIGNSAADIYLMNLLTKKP